MNGKTGGACIGFADLLTLVFIVLKLTHVIDWHWFWVLSPSIFAIVIITVVATVTGIIVYFLKD